MKVRSFYGYKCKVTFELFTLLIITDIDNKAQLSKLADEMKELQNNLKTAYKAIEEKTHLITQKDKEIKILEQENEDKIKLLDKYKSGVTGEMADLQNRISALESEKRKLLLQVAELERYKEDAANALEVQKDEQGDIENTLRSKISEIEQENKMLKKAFDQELNEEKSKQDELRQAISDIRSEKDKLAREKAKLEEQIMKMKKVQNDFYSFKDTIVVTTKKLLKSYEVIDSNLSCLSCLEFLEDPLMLICGHSI